MLHLYDLIISFFDLYCCCQNKKKRIIDISCNNCDSTNHKLFTFDS